MQEKQDNKAIYDAIKELKKPKIAELIPLLSKPLEKAGYIEFHLDEPDMGREVSITFSCLDSKSERDDAHSRKELKKLVETAFKPTNWRLMSDGISYRLGYLSGRIRAYETEEELKKLVEKTPELIKKAKAQTKTDNKDNELSIEGKNGERILL